MIVQRLRAIQDEHGFLPEKELEALARVTGTPLYRIQEVASFFPHFRMEWNKPPHVVVQVCRDYTCHHRGAAKLLSPEGLGQFAKDGKKAVVVEGVSCLGRCDRAPVICVSRYEEHGHAHAQPDPTRTDPGRTDPYLGGHGGHASAHEMIYAGRTAADYARIVKAFVNDEFPPTPDLDATYDLHSNPIPNPEYPTSRYQIDVYAHRPEIEKYSAIRMFLEKHPNPVSPPDKPKDLNEWLTNNYPYLWELSKSGLLGRGGAGVPAFRKWLDVWMAAGDEKYIVINGDESEPGTFKDREILLRMPHLTVEGVILAGLMTNATAGYIYIRHEYTEQIEAVRAEIARAVAMNICGDNILKTGRNFPVDVFVSPGGYICGEQSALLEAMSDRRAQPRNRPPELATNGLRDKPTVVNNVETISWTPAVIIQGGEWYATASTGGLRGRRLISISGDLVRPGVYEVPISSTLGELIHDHCGGIVGGKGVMGLATSGPSGGILPPLIPVPDEDVLNSRIQEQIADKKQTIEDFRKESWDPYLTPDRMHFDLLKLPLDLNVYKLYSKLLGIGGGKSAGMMLGAGIAVFGEGSDILSNAVNFTEFFRNESCGKCVPCRLGSQKLAIMGSDLIQLKKRERISDGILAQAKDTIGTMSETMVATSICSLGQVAPNPLATALDYFRKSIVSPSSGAPRAPKPAAPAAPKARPQATGS